MFQAENLEADGSVSIDTNQEVCQEASCGFYMAIPTQGALQEGSSGSGVVHQGARGAEWSEGWAVGGATTPRRGPDRGVEGD